jgi:hypothetical protein
MTGLDQPLGEGKWAVIESVIAGQLARARRQHRGWTVALVLVIVLFVFLFGSSIAQAQDLSKAHEIMALGRALLSSDASNRLLALAPFGLGGFHALKQMARADAKIEPLELALLLAQNQDQSWKRAWHRANYSDEGDPAMLGMIESMV